MEKDPSAITNAIRQVERRLRSDAGSLDEQARIDLASQLKDVRQKVSVALREPSLLDVLRSRSAEGATRAALLQEERNALEKHRKFIEVNFDKSESYLKTIQVAGYAVFFAIWGFSREWVASEWGAWASLLMILSALTFVGWEIFKATVLGAIQRKHAQIASSRLEDFVLSRSSHFESLDRAVIVFAKYRHIVWVSCVAFALPALLLLISQIVKQIILETGT